MAAAMTTPPEPGEHRPATASGTGDPPRRRVTLDRPPGDRYLPARSARDASDHVLRGVRGPLALVAGGTLVFVVLGGILGITAGLIVAAGILGWLTGLLVRPPLRAALVGLVAVIAGLVGIWLFGRWEGGVLDPITYLSEVQGFVVPLELLAGAGMAAAASR
jgi:hypothetical protein